jgi:NADH-quinone oxidoreductase subunit K
MNSEITEFYLFLGGILFSMGALGVLTRKNTIVIFMCIELMLNAANLTLVALSNHFGSNQGHVYVIFIMAVAAAEAAVGLAIIISIFRNFYSIRVNDINTMHG